MELVLNPRARIRRDGETLWVQTPDPERGLQTYVVTHHDDRSLFETVISIMAPDQSDVELDDVMWDRLGEIGLVVPAPHAVSDLAFACELPCAVPGRDLAYNAHPALAIQRGPELPPAVAQLLHGASLPLAAQFPIAWVTDLITGVPAPYVVAGPAAAALDRLHAGRPAPADLAPHVRADLAQAEIHGRPDFVERRAACWETQPARRNAAMPSAAGPSCAACCRPRSCRRCGPTSARMSRPAMPGAATARCRCAGSATTSTS
ncbi:MAG: hypothetical protein WKG01_35445 [Kofleriaceae bacterium]